MSASPQFPNLPANWMETTRKVVRDQFHVRVWKASNASFSRSLVVIHGYGENSNRYRHFPHYLNGLFSTIVTVDLYGHGLSVGKKGDSNGFANFSDDVLTAIKEVGLTGEVHWFGHSFGGLISLLLLKRTGLEDYKSITVSAPFLALSMVPSAIKVFFGKLIEPILPHLQLQNEVNAGILSHDQSVVHTYTEDPFNHNYITPRTFVGMTQAQAEVIAWQGPIRKPLLCLLPLADQLVDSPTTWRFFAGLKCEGAGKKTLQTFPGFFHESFNETHKGLAFNAFSDFIQALPK